MFDVCVPLTTGIVQKQATDEIVGYNAYTGQYGLVLTPAQAAELVETRTLALQETGRLEFGSGVIGRLIKAFSDSPFLFMHNYVQTLHELIDIFYYYKNETLDLISDNDLIDFMREAFNGRCQGSLDLLAGRELDRLAHSLRFGLPAPACDDADEGGDDEYDEYEEE